MRSHLTIVPTNYSRTIWCHFPEPTYTDPGASASDMVNGEGVNLTPSIVKTGTVNTATLGTQTITYTVTDTGTPPLTSAVSRSVTVVPTHLYVPNNVQASRDDATLYV